MVPGVPGPPGVRIRSSRTLQPIRKYILTGERCPERSTPAGPQVVPGPEWEPNRSRTGVSPPQGVKMERHGSYTLTMPMQGGSDCDSRTGVKFRVANFALFKFSCRGLSAPPVEPITRTRSRGRGSTRAEECQQRFRFGAGAGAELGPVGLLGAGLRCDTVVAPHLSRPGVKGDPLLQTHKRPTNMRHHSTPQRNTATRFTP